MARELTSVEQPLVEGCKTLGWATLKVGWDGWPDRLVFWAPNRHFWVETKNEEGRLTPAQKVRIAWLIRRGETVFVPKSRQDVGSLLGLLS